MKGWMDSGRANPRAESVPASAPGSPNRNGSGNRDRMKPLTAVNTSSHTPQLSTLGAGSKGISADSRRRIWAAMNGFRPKFRQIARTLDEVDLVFIEEAMERWMLQYDRAFACKSFLRLIQIYSDMVADCFYSYTYSFLYMEKNWRDTKSQSRIC